MSSLPPLLTNFGFKELPKDKTFNIRFGILKIYEVEGIFFEEDQGIKRSQIVDFSKQCQIIISHSISIASKLLTGIEFAHLEDGLFRKNTNPPFLLIHFLENHTKSIQGGFGKYEDDILYLHNAFPEGKKEIQDWLKNELPTIVTSMVVKFSSPNKTANFEPVYENIFGLTNDNQVIYDVKVTGQLDYKTGKKTKISEINSLLCDSKKTDSFLSKKDCRNFYEALIEPDKIRQFLGFFHFLERHTNKTFKKIEKSNTYSERINDAFNKPDKLKKASLRYFKKVFKDSKYLSPKFFWCATLEWKNIDDSDITAFNKMKTIRDAYSHGREIDVEKLPIAEAKLLAVKLLDSHIATQSKET